jgi:hypothetical protein
MVSSECTHGRTDVAHVYVVALDGVHQLNQAQLLSLSLPSSLSLTTVHVPIALLLDRVGKVKLVATKHGQVALSRYSGSSPTPPKFVQICRFRRLDFVVPQRHKKAPDAFASSGAVFGVNCGAVSFFSPVRWLC